MNWGDIKEASEVAQWETKILRIRSPFESNMRPTLAGMMNILHRERFYPQNEPLDWWKEPSEEVKRNWIPAAHGNALTFNMPR